MGRYLWVCLAFFVFSNGAFGQQTSQIKSQTNRVTEGQKNRRFLGLSGGVINYPKSAEVQAINGAGGFNIGVALPYSFWLEGGFYYSYQQIQNPVSKALSDVDQFALTVKPTYQWDIPGFWITPIVGFNLSYTIRSYNGFSSKTNAFDLGPAVGFDIDFTDSFTVGFEYRYMYNLGYDSDVEANQGPTVASWSMNTTVEDTVIEDFQYQMSLMTVKWKF